MNTTTIRRLTPSRRHQLLAIALRALRIELPGAIEAIRKAGVGPVDMQQSVIGPGMGIFTRHSKVLEDEDATMTVKTALALINRVWEEIESELDANFDAETQVALAWFATYGLDTRASGELITLANAKNVPLGTLFTAKVFKDLHGRAENDDRADWSEAWVLFPGTVVYVWHAGIKAGIVQASLEACGFDTRAQIVWAKNNFAIGRGHYHCKHELVRGAQGRDGPVGRRS